MWSGDVSPHLVAVCVIFNIFVCDAYLPVARNAHVGFNDPDESLKLFGSLPSLLLLLLCCKQGFAHLPLPFSCPDCPGSTQTWLFAHSRELWFRLKFFGFLVALMSFCLQLCPRTQSVRQSFLHFWKTSSVNQSNLYIFSWPSSQGCFCLADKTHNLWCLFLCQTCFHSQVRWWARDEHLIGL